MEKVITKYQVTRISKSLTTYAERRSYTYFDNLDEAVDWAKRHSTKDNIECRVFALECEWDENDAEYIWPMGSRCKETEWYYEPVFRKIGDRILVDVRKEEEDKAVEEASEGKYKTVEEWHADVRKMARAEVEPVDLGDDFEVMPEAVVSGSAPKNTAKESRERLQPIKERAGPRGLMKNLSMCEGG